MNKTDQQAFEAWAADRGLDLTLTTDGIGLDKYQSVSTQAAFAAWQERDAQLAAVTRQLNEMVEAVKEVESWLDVEEGFISTQSIYEFAKEMGRDLFKLLSLAARIQSAQPQPGKGGGDG